MDTQEFNKNDKVKLKSGGPIMVIARFEIDGAGATRAVCGWFSIAKNQKTATIPVGMLEHAEQSLLRPAVGRFLYLKGFLDGLPPIAINLDDLRLRARSLFLL